MAMSLMNEGSGVNSFFVDSRNRSVALVIVPETVTKPLTSKNLNLNYFHIQKPFCSETSIFKIEVMVRMDGMEYDGIKTWYFVESKYMCGARDGCDLQFKL
jgi:hypothetical protein